MATRADTTEAPPPAETVDRATKWAIALFFVALFIPGNFEMGVRMSPYRLYLIAMAIPAVLRYRADPTLRLTAVDALMFLACAWRSLSVFANHGMSEIPFAGASFMELFFGYLLGRVYIRNAAAYKYLFQCYLVFLAVSLPFAVLEAVLRRRVLRDIFSVVFFHSERSMDGGQIRFGLLRPLVSFEHALLFGTFCAIGLGNVFYIYKDEAMKKWPLVFFVTCITFLAISTSSIINVFMQYGMIVYNNTLRAFRTRWLWAILGSLLFLLMFRTIFGMNIIEYAALELALSEAAGATRLGQIEWGLKEVYRNPVFGIGLDEWVRPFWQSSVFDNFWLATMVRAGVPAAAFLVLVFLVHTLAALSARQLSDVEARVRTGHLIPLVALFFTLGMHGLWGGMLVFVMFYIGAGAWIYDTPRVAPPRPWRARPAPEAPRRPARPRAPVTRR
jgi:hypothetical protein